MFIFDVTILYFGTENQFIPYFHANILYKLMHYANLIKNVIFFNRTSVLFKHISTLRF